MIERAPDRGQHVYSRAVGARLGGSGRARETVRQEAALELDVDRPVVTAFAENVLAYPTRVRERAGIDCSAGGFDIAARAFLDGLPLGLSEPTRHEVFPQPHQRVACHFGRKLLRGLVRLRVLTRVS